MGEPGVDPRGEHAEQQHEERARHDLRRERVVERQDDAAEHRAEGREPDAWNQQRQGLRDRGRGGAETTPAASRPRDKVRPSTPGGVLSLIHVPITHVAGRATPSASSTERKPSVAPPRPSGASAAAAAVALARKKRPSAAGASA